MKIMTCDIYKRPLMVSSGWISDPLAQGHWLMFGGSPVSQTGGVIRLKVMPKGQASNVHLVRAWSVVLWCHRASSSHSKTQKSRQNLECGCKAALGYIRERDRLLSSGSKVEQGKEVETERGDVKGRGRLPCYFWDTWFKALPFLSLSLSLPIFCSAILHGGLETEAS